ncbi:MAG: guanylate kinase [Clostridia bacterium]|jgi:guanylate kinase|nr:guanylate kinase [Clostridia bacterium]
MKRSLFVISGPSGVGKGTLVNRLLQEDDSLALSVSCTTRAPREGEKDGREYFFLTKEEFSKRIGEDGFLEWDEHFGNCYGTPKEFVLRQLESKSVILEIDVKGALQVKNSGFEHTVLIMIVPPDPETLMNRLSQRGSETEAELEKRLERVRFELSQNHLYDYTVVNDDLEEATRALQNIILKETFRGDKHD